MIQCTVEQSKSAVNRFTPELTVSYFLSPTLLHVLTQSV